MEPVDIDIQSEDFPPIKMCVPVLVEDEMIIVDEEENLLGNFDKIIILKISHIKTIISCLSKVTVLKLEQWK